MSVNSKMTAIADAIRNLLDINEIMGLDAMANNISSITKRGAVAGTISTKAEQYIIPAGYHNGNGTVGISSDEQEKIIAENIKSGVTILGVAGSASGDIFSIISVTYPAGSTCTCSDGTTTLTARDTSGTALFNVPSAGTWTVSCTDGTNTKAESIEITSVGQVVSIELSYALYLYSKGNMHTDAGGNWSTSGYSRAGWGNFNNIPPENTDEGLSISPGTQICVFGKENKVDLTKYSKLSFTVATNTTEQPQCFVTSTKSLMQESNTVANIRFNKQTGEITLDISSISDFYYVAFAFYTGVCLIEEVKLT